MAYIVLQLNALAHSSILVKTSDHLQHSIKWLSVLFLKYYGIYQTDYTNVIAPIKN